MYIPLYIPKSVIVGFLFVAGCALGWMLHGSSSDVKPEALLQSSPTVAGPPLMGSAPTAASIVPQSTGYAETPGSTVSISTGSGGSSWGGAQSTGYAKTPGSTVSISTGPDGANSGGVASAGYAATPQSAVWITTAPGAPPLQLPPTTPAVPAVPTAPSYMPSYAAPASAPAYTPSYAAPAYTPSYAAPAYTPSYAAPAYATPSYAPYTAATPPTPPTQPLPFVIPPFFGEQLFTPLPGTDSRGIAFSEWESYRTDVSGRNILVTTDDSNFFRDRNGKINGNTGDTDASGLNVTDAVDSVIRGTESADEAPWQTMAAALVDLASDSPGGGLGSDPDDDPDDDGDTNAPDPGANPPPPFAMTTAPMAATTAETTPSSDGGDESNGDAPFTAGATQPTQGTQSTGPTSPAATAAVMTSDPSSPEEWDFPYLEWVRQINGDFASSVHTDEGTTLASGQEALVIGADGYDDDDNRATGENITITRDDGNVVIGGTGDVNAQIGDSEQGAVIMNVVRTFIQGGGAY